LVRDSGYCLVYRAHETAQTPDSFFVLSFGLALLDALLLLLEPVLMVLWGKSPLLPPLLLLLL